MAEFLGLWTFIQHISCVMSLLILNFILASFKDIMGFFLFLHIFHPVTVFRRTLPQVQNVVRTLPFYVFYL